jgi:hypothetical protein
MPFCNPAFIPFHQPIQNINEPNAPSNSHFTLVPDFILIYIPYKEELIIKPVPWFRMPVGLANEYERALYL